MDLSSNHPLTDPTYAHKNEFFTQKSKIRPSLSYFRWASHQSKTVINYSDSVPLFFFLAFSWLHLPSFVFIAHYFSTLLDYKSWTAFRAFIGLHFSSLFISFSFHPISRLASCWYWLPQLTWQYADVSVLTNLGFSFPEHINQYSAV